MITVNEGKLEYVSSGIFKSQGSWIHPRRTIDSYEIIFMHEGEVYIAEGEQEYTLVKNDVLLLEPDVEHYGFRESGEGTSFSWLHFRTDKRSYTSVPKHSSLISPYEVNTLFSQCIHSVNTPNYSPAVADLYTALIIEELVRQTENVSHTSNRLASEIKEYIRLNVEKNLSVKAVALRFGYHENHIAKLFRSAYGVRIRDYISGQKIEYAKNLLHTTLYTVSEISFLLSFKTENHFVKFFKYHTGITPTEYRNSYGNTHMNKS